MTWAKKKKMIFLFSSVSAVLIVPQLVSIPLYSQLANNSADKILDVANRPQKSQIQLNGENSSRSDNSNKDLNLDIAKPPKTPVVAVIPPKVLPPKPKVEEKPKVIIPIAPPVVTKPIIIPIRPIVIPKVPVAPIPVPKVEPAKPKPEAKPVPATPAVTPPPVTPTPSEIKPEPVVQPVVVTPPVVKPVTPVVAPPVAEPVVTPKQPFEQPNPNPNPTDTPPLPVIPKTGNFVPGDGEEIVTSGITLRIPDRSIVTKLRDGTVVTGGDKTITAAFRVITRKAPSRHSFSVSDKAIENRIPYTSNIAPDIVKFEVTNQLIDAMKESYIAILKFDIQAGVKDKNYSATPDDKIDWNNLKFSADAMEKIKAGNALNPSSLFIDNNGNINSSSWGPISDKFNNTVSLYARDNEKYRTFGYKQWYPRTPDSIQNGDFPGWIKTDVKKDWMKFGLTNTDGIEVYKYTNSDPTFSKNNDAIRVVLDAANKEGYNKYISFLKKVEADPSRKITSFVIKNMGEGEDGANQKFRPILEALPNKITNLVLWLEQPTATSYLEVLRHKKIDELSLYTTKNSLRSDWSINPFSVQNTAFITWQDYNVSSSFEAGYKPATRVNISTFAFDPDNYKANSTDPLKEINEGLRMGYLVRNNERFFQGENGRGLGSPDNSESTNTYWPNLDLSRIPQIRSLRGLNFTFVDGKGNAFTRKVSKLTLYNDSPVFTITTDELNNSNFYTAMHLPPSPGNPTDRIAFKGGPAVKYVRVVSNGVGLTADGTRNLETFYREVGKDYFSGAPILVNNGDTTATADLNAAGYTIAPYSSDLSHNIN